MYRFETKSGRHAFLDAGQCRSYIPVGSGAEEWTRVVLDGGDSVVVKGGTEATIQALFGQHAQDAANTAATPDASDAARKK
jgi:hypothetical protein